MQMLIGGKYVDASDGATIAVVNPVTGKAVDAVPAATLEDLDRGIALAVEGQKEWKEVPLHEKIRILEKYACLIEEEADQIAGVMCEEGGKPIGQNGSVCQCGYFQNILRRGIYVLWKNPSVQRGGEVPGGCGDDGP